MTPRCRPLFLSLLLGHRQSALPRGPVSSTNRILTGAAVSHASIRSARLGIGRPSSSSSPLCTSSSSIDNDRPDDADVYSESDIKEGILAAALEFVPTHGWTRESIVEAALKYGYPGVAHGMFPGGGADLANYFNAACNAELRQYLQDTADEGIPSQTTFIRDAVEQRLRMTLPVKDTWHEAMAVLACPSGVQGAWNNLTELVDDIWFYAGDRSVDSNWYTKRALLASVYKTTELFMIQDTSEGHRDTWSFLDRRLEDIAALGTAIRRQKEFRKEVFGSLVVFGRTFVNMSGIPSK